MDLKQLIVKRKSIRKYDMNPLAEETLNAVEGFVNGIGTPFGGKFGVKIFDKSEYDAKTGGRYKIPAPHYLMFYGDKKDDTVLRSIGFAGELAALKLAEMNLGTCWLGGATSKEKDYVISVAFGVPNEEFRKSAAEAKRKPLTEIAEGYAEEQRDVLESVRLAPSAMNLQPWYFKCGGSKVRVFRKKSLISNIALLKTMQKIDIGIAISHFKTPFTVENEVQKRKGCSYECTLVLQM